MGRNPSISSVRASEGGRSVRDGFAGCERQVDIDDDSGWDSTPGGPTSVVHFPCWLMSRTLWRRFRVGQTVGTSQVWWRGSLENHRGCRSQISSSRGYPIEPGIPVSMLGVRRSPLGRSLTVALEKRRGLLCSSRIQGQQEWKDSSSGSLFKYSLNNIWKMGFKLVNGRFSCFILWPQERFLCRTGAFLYRSIRFII